MLRKILLPQPPDLLEARIVGPGGRPLPIQLVPEPVPQPGAFAVVHTGEPQPWGNFLFKKGVICEPLVP